MLTEHSIVLAGLISFANLGCVGYLCSRYLKRVDKHDEVIPALLQSLNDNTKALEALWKSHNALTVLVYQLLGEHNNTKNTGIKC